MAQKIIKTLKFEGVSDEYLINAKKLDGHTWEEIPTYTLTKSGSEIVLTRSDGESSSVTDAVGENAPEAGTDFGLVKSGGDATIDNGIITVDKTTNKLLTGSKGLLATALEQPADSVVTYQLAGEPYTADDLPPAINGATYIYSAATVIKRFNNIHVILHGIYSSSRWLPTQYNTYTGAWRGWTTNIDSSNIGAQSVNKANSITATALDMSGGNTIANLQTQLKKWLSNNTQSPGACCTFVGALSDIMAKWSNTANTFDGGVTNTVHLETYSSGNYALLRFTRYENKEVYYAALSNNTWGPMHKVVFNNDIAGTQLGLVKSGGDITVASDGIVTVNSAESLKPVELILASEERTVSGLRTKLADWVKTHSGKPGSCVYFSSDLIQLVKLWNNESTTTAIPSGPTILVTLDSSYGGGNYAALRFSTYSDTQIYYATLQNGTWKPLRKVTFDQDIYSMNKEAYFTWGGKSLSGNVSPLDAAMSLEHSANRLAFANPGGVVIEYSRDQDSTWTTYPTDNASKTKLISGIGSGYHIGYRYSGGTVNDKLRITLRADALGIYCYARKILLNVSTNGCTGCKVTVEYLTNSTQQYSTMGTYDVSGWSGWNSIPVGLTFGNVNWGYNELRLTFSVTEVPSSANNFSISSMILFGDTAWTTQSYLARTGHLYSYDENQNAIFPAQVTATKFIGDATGLDNTETWYFNCGTASTVL